MKYRILTYVFVLLIGLCSSPSLLDAAPPEGDITVNSEGFGNSKTSALLDAKRNAVEQGIGTVLISQTEVKSFELQKDVVLTNTLGSIKKYELLEENQQSNLSYHIRIRAVVSLANIKSNLMALKILLESMDKPRIMVVISEPNGKTSETAIVNYLRSKEFDLVDPAMVAALMQKRALAIQRVIAGEATVAAKLGVENGAEYILIGQVSTNLLQSRFLAETDIKSGQATITAKVIDCSTARIIASKSAASVQIHSSEEVAMTKAAEQAARKLMDQELFETIISSFQDIINNGVALEVSIKNVANFRTQKAVQSVLNDISQVVSVHRRSFGDGWLRLSVRFKGNADTFSEKVDGLSVAGNRLAVTDISGNAVTMQLE
jgi:hypothetical protein